MTEVKDTDNKGKGVYSTRIYQPGTDIFLEDPIVWVDTDNHQVNNNNDNEINDSCCFRTMFDGLEDSNIPKACETGKSKCNECANKLSDDILKLHFQLERLCFASKNIVTDKIDIIGLYENACMVNHSCRPNAEYMIDKKGKLRLFSLKQIGEGDEITISYLDDLIILNHMDVRDHIEYNMGFKCLCNYCLDKMEEIEEQEELRKENKGSPILRDPIEYFKNMTDLPLEQSENIQGYFTKFNDNLNEELVKDENVYTNKLLLIMDCFSHLDSEKYFVNFINDNDTMLLNIREKDICLAIIFFEKFMKLGCQFNNLGCIAMAATNLQHAINDYVESENSIKFTKHYVLFLLSSAIVRLVDYRNISHLNSKYCAEQAITLYKLLEDLGIATSKYYGLNISEFLKSTQGLRMFYEMYKNDIDILCNLGSLLVIK